MAPELHEASSIREFFAGRHVLITGATGFIGSVLLEKLLRSCQQIDTLYLLLRPRRGKNVEERVQDLLKSPLFRNIDAKQKTKVKAVEGDMSLANLGFNPDERISLCRRVSVVFHAAATINFNAALQSAINTNLRGTQCVLELCHQMPQLQALVYVSSAYCNSKLGRVLLEQVYPSQYHPQEVLDLVKKLSPEQILAATPE
ncbi:putative fatty acyl-CoA reductase [Blattella germanica]|nr:putative fatty acyl-CoA reductase [Blattella germanica]